MSSTVAYPRTQTTTSNRRKNYKKKVRRTSQTPFQTDITSQYIYIKKVGRLPLRKGILIEVRDTPGFKEDAEIEIPIQYRGKPAVVLVSTSRAKFPVQIESCPIQDSGKYAVFAHGVLLNLEEPHRGKKAFRLLSQHANACDGVNGRRCSYAKFLHNHAGRKSGVTKLTLSRKGN
jgi:hypothetical protein